VTFAKAMRAGFAWFQHHFLARHLDALAATGGQLRAGVELAVLRLETFVSLQPAFAFIEIQTVLILRHMRVLTTGSLRGAVQAAPHKQRADVGVATGEVAEKV
jgi:hypothetical protein